MYNAAIVPADFSVPGELETPRIRLRPLTIHDAVKDFDLTQHEMTDARHSVAELIDIYGLDSIDFTKGMLARQMAWANLVAQDFEKARYLKETQIMPDGRPYGLVDKTHEQMHIDACNAVSMRATRVVKAERREKTERKSKRKAKEL